MPKRITDKEIKNIFNLRYNELPNGCWEWNSTLHHTRGYGVIRYSNKTWLAHRLSYILNKGKIPTGMSVLHSCHFRKCVNPDHLRLGTQADNNLDTRLSGRHGKNNLKGSKCGNSKINEEAAREIFKMKGKLSQHKVAKLFGVSRGVVSAIFLGITWTHVTDDLSTPVKILSTFKVFDKRNRKSKQIVSDKSNGLCYYCNGVAEEYDHVIPLSKGGNNSIDNVVLVCMKCNRSKGNKTIEKWLVTKKIEFTNSLLDPEPVDINFV